MQSVRSPVTGGLFTWLVNLMFGFGEEMHGMHIVDEKRLYYQWQFQNKHELVRPVIIQPKITDSRKSRLSEFLNGAMLMGAEFFSRTKSLIMDMKRYGIRVLAVGEKGRRKETFHDDDDVGRKLCQFPQWLKLERASF